MSHATYPLRAGSSAPRRRPRAAGPGSALWLAAALVGALVLTWVLAELVPAFEARDEALLYHFTQLGGDRVHEAARVVIHLLDPLLFTLWALALVAIAIARGRLRVALAASV